MLSRQGWALWWLRNVTYFTTFVATGAWLLRFAGWARGRFRSPVEALREMSAEIALALGATAVLFLTHDWQFKVLSDETNFVGLGRSLAFSFRFELVEQAKVHGGDQHALTYLFDKRPPLFAFVLGLVDVVSGYRVRNVWLLNGAILGATVVVVGAALRRRLGRPWNLLAVVWALANPVVMLTARGATVEPLFCLLWAIAGACLLDVLEAPTAPTVRLLVATSVLLGLCRVEGGPMAALMFGGIVLASRERRRILELVRDDVVVWSAPLLALPVLIQRTRLGAYNDAVLTGGKEYGLAYLVENASNWATILGDGGRAYPFSAVVTVVEGVAFVVLVALVASRRTARSRAEIAALAIFSTLTAAVVVLYSTYFWGQPVSPLCARFYALPLFFAGLTVPALLLRFDAARTRPALAAVAFALVFAFAFPASHSGVFGSQLGPGVLHETLARHLLAQPPAKQILVVTQLPGELVIYDVGAITFETWRRSREQVRRELDQKLYDEVLFVQLVDVATRRPTAATAVAPDIALETVLERQFGALRFVRISRMKR